MTDASAMRRSFSDRYPSLVYAIFGLLIMLIGGAIFVYFYAWASMVDPDLAGVDYWRAVFRTLIPSLLLPLVIFMAGAAAFLVCVGDVFFGAARAGPSIKIGFTLWSVLTAATYLGVWIFVAA